jgi:hypothetical protein
VISRSLIEFQSFVLLPSPGLGEWPEATDRGSAAEFSSLLEPLSNGLCGAARECRP